MLRGDEGPTRIIHGKKEMLTLIDAFPCLTLTQFQGVKQMVKSLLASAWFGIMKMGFGIYTRLSNLEPLILLHANFYHDIPISGW